MAAAKHSYRAVTTLTWQNVHFAYFQKVTPLPRGGCYM